MFWILFHKLYLMILCSSIGRFYPLEVMCSCLGSYHTRNNFSCQIEVTQPVLFCIEILFNVQVCVDETYLSACGGWQMTDPCIKAGKGGDWIQVSFILILVYSKQLISGISEVFLVFFPWHHHRVCCWPVLLQRSWIFCFCCVPSLSWHRGMNCGHSALGLI